MGISIGETSGKIIGAMIKTKGEESVKKAESAGDQTLFDRCPGVG